jgi:hypothetical protein
MKLKTLFIFFIFLITFWISVCADINFKEEKYALNGIDGPYIFNQDQSVLVYEIDEENSLNFHETNRTDTFKVVVPNETNDTFYFTLQDSLKVSPDCYPHVNKIFAVSDIEGNFNVLASLLQGNGIIDENFNWAFGDGHLVVNGDMVDRGELVTQVLWLIYKLEQQAQAQNGMVHVILGNHENMDIKGRTDYAQDKYIAAAQMISKRDDPSEALRYLFSKNAELGKWLRSKNSIERIGDIIFVHAGLSSELIEYDFTFQQINDSIRAYLDYQTSEIENDRARFLFRSFGPLWFRGMVMDYKDYYTKVTQLEVDSILAHYNANNIVISHTILDSVSTDYNGRVIRIDVHQPTKKNTGNAQALLIENNNFYRVNDLGEKVKLK